MDTEYITVTQFVHPFGERKLLKVKVPKYIAELSREQILTCECMPHDYSSVAFYSAPKGVDLDEYPEAETVYFAQNGPGKFSTRKVLMRLILDCKDLKPEDFIKEHDDEL